MLKSVTRDEKVTFIGIHFYLIIFKPFNGNARMIF